MSSPEGGDPEARRDGDEAEGGLAQVDRFLRPLLSDSTLWPVLIVVLAILATFFASVVLVAWRRQSLFAVAALLGLVWLTVEPLRGDLRRRRLGPTSALLLALWALVAAIVVVGARSGVL